MKKIIVSLLLVVMLLSAVACGGAGGLSENFGISEDNIVSISKRTSNGRSSTIDASKYEIFMETFDVAYEGSSSSSCASSTGVEYTVTYNGTSRIVIAVLTDGRVSVHPVGYGDPFYVSVDPIEIPFSI